MRLKIKHNAEIAHRLSLDTGKCQQIHGHGLQIELTLLGSEGPDGMALNSASEVLEFGDIKRKFRNFIDSTYDHHLLLNKDDPWAQTVKTQPDDNDSWTTLPGLVTTQGDPTTENIAKWIADWAASTFRCDVICHIEETKTNGVEVMYHWNGFNTRMAGGSIL